MPQNFRVYDQMHPHFITSSIVYFIPVFCRDEYFKIVADSLTYCSEQKGLLIHAYVIMPNHIHLVCSQKDGMLSSVIGDMKQFTSREIVKKLEEDGRHTWLSAMKRAAGECGSFKVWDEAFHPEQIHSEPFLKQKIDYTHNNPVKAGYVNDPCDWKYSSASAYYRDVKSIIPITRIDL